MSLTQARALLGIEIGLDRLCFHFGEFARRQPCHVDAAVEQVVEGQGSYDCLCTGKIGLRWGKIGLVSAVE